MQLRCCKLWWLWPCYQIKSGCSPSKTDGAACCRSQEDRQCPDAEFPVEARNQPLCQGCSMLGGESADVAKYAKTETANILWKHCDITKCRCRLCQACPCTEWHCGSSSLECVTRSAWKDQPPRAKLRMLQVILAPLMRAHSAHGQWHDGTQAAFRPYECEIQTCRAFS